MDSIPVRERFLPVLDERTDAPKDRIPVDCGTGCKANRGQRDDLSAMINGLRSSPVPASSACWRFLHKNHPTAAPASNPNKCAQLSIPGTIHPKASVIATVKISGLPNDAYSLSESPLGRT